MQLTCKPMSANRFRTWSLLALKHFCKAILSCWTRLGSRRGIAATWVGCDAPPSRYEPAWLRPAIKAFGPTTQQHRQPGRRKFLVRPSRMTMGLVDRITKIQSADDLQALERLLTLHSHLWKRPMRQYPILTQRNRSPSRLTFDISGWWDTLAFKFRAILIPRIKLVQSTIRSRN